MAARRIAVPNIRQETDATCGAACVRAVLRFVGSSVDEKPLARVTRTRRDGCDPIDLVRGLRHYGLRSLRSTALWDMTDAQLRGAIGRGFPVIIGIRDPDDEGHWVVARGFDHRGVDVMDPWRGGLVITWADLAARWWDVEGRPPRLMKRFGLVVRAR